MINSSRTVSYLLFLLQSAETIPCGDDSLVLVVNFLHSVSLKEGVVRAEKVPKSLNALMVNIFTCDKFY